MLATRLPGALPRPEPRPRALFQLLRFAARQASSQRSNTMTESPSPEDKNETATTPEPETPAAASDPNGVSAPPVSVEDATAEAAVAADAPSLDDAVPPAAADTPA